MNLTTNTTYLILFFSVIIIIIFYKNDNKHFLNNIFHSHKHKIVEKFSTKQNLNIKTFLNLLKMKII